MTEKENLEANEMLESICAMLDARDWVYEKVEDRLLVRFIVTGEDFPMNFIIRVDPERKLVLYTSRLPGKFPEELRETGAVATCQLNFKLADGSFDYDMSDGTVYFRLTSSYRSSLISQAALVSMLDISLYTVDRYNDMFTLLAKGTLDLQNFLDSL